VTVDARPRAAPFTALAARLRAAALAALAATLAAAAPALAQDPSSGAAPVVGGGSPNAAPLLEPGAYRDTILSGETLFYAIRIEPGEQLRLRATVDADEAAWESASVMWLEAEARTALREPLELAYADGGEDDGSFARGPGGRLERLTEPAETLREAAGATRYLGPGVWYASFYARPIEGRRRRVEVPFSFELAKEGTPVPDEPAPGVPPPPRPTAAPDATGGNSGTGTGTILGVGAAGLLGGLLLGGLARRRARP
jgi:hypothetical protein